jgi:hypothetical protein
MHGILGLALAFTVGIVLGFLGGGGSILAVPIFLYIFRVPTNSAIAMSLPVVSMSAFVGFLTHWRQGSVNLRVGIPFAICATISAFLTGLWAHLVAEWIRLGLFAVFALTAALFMLRDSLRETRSDAPAIETPPHFSVILALTAVGVGALTSIIGAGGGFIIVPALVFFAMVPVKQAVGSSLLVITANAFAGFLGNIGRVPIDWRLVLSFTAVAALGALAGSRLHRIVPQRRIKQSFAAFVIVLWLFVIGRQLLGH